MSSDPQKGSKVYNSLLNNGPQTKDELGSHPNTTLRQDGVWRLNPLASRGSRTPGTVGLGTKAVYYIKDKHTPKTVIRKWLDVNEISDHPISNRTIHRRIAKHSEDFRQPSYEILGPFEARVSSETLSKASKEGRQGECPLCGENYTAGLPNHLPCDND